MSKTNKGQVVWITGASSGIGRALALEYAKRGADLILTARRTELLEELAGEIDKLGQQAALCAADVTDWEALSAVPAEAAKLLGTDRIDVAIANAGVLAPGPVNKLEASDETWMVDVNVNGVIHTVHSVLSAMLERGEGRIVAIASIAGRVHMPGRAGYSASKAFVNQYMSALRIELLESDLSVTVVNPGYVESAMTDWVEHHMPFFWRAERAARVIADGVARRKRFINFPWQLHLAITIGNLLPNFLNDWVLKGQQRD